MESDADLVEAANFRKYEYSLLRRREGFGRNRMYRRGSAGEFQTTTTAKSAKHLLWRSEGGKRSGERKRKSSKMRRFERGSSKGSERKGKGAKGKDSNGGRCQWERFQRKGFERKRLQRGKDIAKSRRGSRGNSQHVFSAHGVRAELGAREATK